MYVCIFICQIVHDCMRKTNNNNKKTTYTKNKCINSCKKHIFHDFVYTSSWF